MMPAEKIVRSFRVEVEGGVALCLLDVQGEPVNTLSPQVGAELEDLLAALAKDPAVEGVVIASGKKEGFIAGAKIDVIRSARSAAEAEALSRSGQRQFDALERFPKPVVAAIHGACLGGGLELALACRWRVVSDDRKTQLGLPEVQLGLIPGAGGTQRLPRLVGIAAALDLILTGKGLKARKAQKLGLADEVVPAPILLEVARRRARELATGQLRRPQPGGVKQLQRGGLGALQKLALEDNPLGRELLFREARRKVLKKSGGHYPALEKALEAVKHGLDKGMEAGLEREAKLFGELAVSEVSKRLVDIFFATTALKKDTGVDDPAVKARRVETVGVLGGGLMGSGIAFVTVGAGLAVRVREKDDAAAARALASVRGLLDEKVKRRSMTPIERGATMRLLTASTGWAGFERVDLVIEAVFEDLALKQEMVRAFEQVNPRGIFASNTSSIPIAKIAEASTRPERVLGMHYFSPVQKMPLLEVIVTPLTAPDVTATAVAVGKKQGKTVIVVNDGPGFYTSRILTPYMNEAAEILIEGASVEDLDGALTAFGMPVGPITLLDEVGVDVGAKVAKILHAAFGDRMTPPAALEKLTADGRLGRKSKKGFYTYGGKKKEVDVTVYDLLPGGRQRKRVSRDEIAERVTLQLVNEAIRCLGEGILRSARDGDVGAIFGLGFPPFLGGPFRYADAVGPKTLLERLERWHDKFGDRFEPAPLLVEVARDGRRFYPDARPV
ncbi:fatty acid oxidation complex subunit alpha FadJ [Anaeromyxobacter diazotrophicus]|uniref:enoyl-CoA hydratase n=1 Tax=Anaeromyxobacter diazotrophicus TaxID=2590199 RepID=A0A7I9VR79_9BACT|nr:fatty acid oxidation complex subunit alpha FadJ [Anaeromyxobacter diazotrophicus]GEJ58467.1 fatty acid oxidation complex subunit alpha [Anaeromyxobacter diazotrophicus]